MLTDDDGRLGLAGLDGGVVGVAVVDADGAVHAVFVVPAAVSAALGADGAEEEAPGRGVDDEAMAMQAADGVWDEWLRGFFSTHRCQ